MANSLENEIVLSNLKFENTFEQLQLIGRGSFGSVEKVREKTSGKEFAIKTVRNDEDSEDTFEIKCVLNEIRIINKLKSIYTVDFIDAWYEKQCDDTFVYIQMELCLSNLNQLIKLKPRIFERTESGQIMNANEYSISLKLFRELTECLNYLHQLKPPIIHRDLNPNNVLICDRIDGRLLKLCDFGLSKTHQFSSHTRDVGTRLYMAPEVLIGRKYNTSADVYSLCLIGFYLFSLEIPFREFDFNNCKSKLELELKRKLEEYTGTSMEQEFRRIFEQIRICLLEDNYKERYSCQQFLDLMAHLSIDDQNSKDQINYMYIKFISDFKDKLFKQNK